VLYHLLAPLAKQHIFFNLFNYLTFRAAGAVVTALLLAFLCGPPFIRRLRERNVGQVIRAEGPAHTRSGHADHGRADHHFGDRRADAVVGAAR